LSSGSFSDLIKAVLSTKSSIFLYKSGNQAKPFYALQLVTCYKNFNKFVRSDDSLNELSKTDDYQLTKCFHSLIRWNIAM
jgi:hypothetical protein